MEKWRQAQHSSFLGMHEAAVWNAGHSFWGVVVARNVSWIRETWAAEEETSVKWGQKRVINESICEEGEKSQNGLRFPIKYFQCKSFIHVAL